MRKQISVFFLLALILSACNVLTDRGEPIAKVGKKILTEEDLSKNVPEFLDATDSLLWAEDYIKKWIQRELLLLKAEENLKENQKDVSAELEEYRNSLIVFNYKNELIREKMDTVLKDSDIQKYFNEHRESFILNRNIVKAIYIKIPVELSSPENIRELCASSNPELVKKLNDYCLTYAKTYDRFNDQWVAADLVLKNIPEEIDDQKEFLDKNRFSESNDKVYYYILYIRDYRLEGQISPIEYVESDIRNILLSKQKLEFLKKIEHDIYEEGIQSNKVKLYKTKI
jgi:predicted small secreted protein